MQENPIFGAFLKFDAATEYDIYSSIWNDQRAFLPLIFDADGVATNLDSIGYDHITTKMIARRRRASSMTMFWNQLDPINRYLLQKHFGLQDRDLRGIGINSGDAAPLDFFVWLENHGDRDTRSPIVRFCNASDAQRKEWLSQYSTLMWVNDAFSPAPHEAAIKELIAHAHKVLDDHADVPDLEMTIKDVIRLLEKF